ncbi:putative vacuolar segregation protein [Talaromyces proteolyticus]|uniref:Vacuolar segregation protein n=1 Tax=Talaromyces proteolyticus TaxID=1131652 RepID=A0AAD4KMF0_9EURO|nr:putative vacuolar segregation protein [Talaromyces proteolyticus]KAH8694987.1 putative vacuolar segregation protein [Talaromyces proteolyticus]
MARRVLGGGRVLGSGKNLSPATSTPSPQPKAHLSPSASSLSLNSQASASQFSSEAQDLTSRISLDNGETSISAAPAVSGSQLACPICSEEMVTLLQLNRHLDDAHHNLEEVRQDEVKDWFKAQMDKAKRFQPLAVLNQKLKGLDVFESNENSQGPSVAAPRPATSTSVEVRQPDPDEVVTRHHWQPRGPYDVCYEPSCGKRLTAANGCVNCRKCGLLFCEEHTMYQMKLSRSAQHEPVRGLWCRVCETCYKSREGYNDHTGFTKDHTEIFSQFRKNTVDKAFLEVSRLEKRLSRLTQALASLPAEQIQTGTSKIWPLGWQGDQRREVEQSIVSWQDDGTVSRCPFCQQDFTNYTFRRHHCRTCGRVVCGDPSTACSIDVGLTVLSKNSSEKSVPAKVNVDIRLCKECRSTLFSRRDFDKERTIQAPISRAYGNLIQFERGIRLLLPRFQKLLAVLQDPNIPPTHTQLSEASKVRKRLIDSFAQYDTAARRIRDMPTTSPTQQKLQKSIYQQATNFLHLHMLPLKSLPKILKHATPNGQHSNGSVRSATTSPLGNTTHTSALASIKYGSNNANGSGYSITSDNSSAISALETEEKELRERLIVLEEQKFFVSEMIADANRRRRFDEVSSLAVNVEDLSREIDRINGMLSQLDFEGVYTSNQ